MMFINQQNITIHSLTSDGGSDDDNGNNYKK